MIVLGAAGLAAAAAACLVSVPRDAALRVQAVLDPGRHDPLRAAGAVAQGHPGRRRTVASGAAVRRTGTVPVLSAVLLVPAVLLLPVVTAPRLLVPLLLAVTGVLAVGRLRRTRTAAAARREERARAVEACAALAGELRAGRAPADALDAAAELGAGPFAATLRTAAGAVRLGGDPVPALHPPAGCAAPEVLRALAACWAVCAGSGSGLAAAVERLEEGLRADQAQRRAVDAELAGPRATAGLLAVLPAGGLLLAAGLGADPLTVLLTTPLGLTCLTVGLGLDALGVWWTGRLVASVGGRP